jgi:hypothetical protein
MRPRDLAALSSHDIGIRKDDVDFIFNTTRDLLASSTREDASKSFTPEVELLMKQAKDSLLITIQALSGTKKILEQLYGAQATVAVDKNEKDLKAALKRVFGTESEVITFQMYKHVLEQKKKIAEEIHRSVVDAQSRS